MAIIQDYPEDKERYMFLKDSLNIYRNHTLLDIRCLSCRNRKHLLNECPLLFYKPKKKVIYSNYHAEIEK